MALTLSGLLFMYIFRLKRRRQYSRDRCCRAVDGARARVCVCVCVPIDENIHSVNVARLDIQSEPAAACAHGRSHVVRTVGGTAGTGAEIGAAAHAGNAVAGAGAGYASYVRDVQHAVQAAHEVSKRVPSSAPTPVAVAMTRLAHNRARRATMHFAAWRQRVRQTPRAQSTTMRAPQ